MRKMLVISLIWLVSSSVWADQIVKKNLGDINGDGKMEIAIEKTNCGSSCFTNVNIQSGRRTILTLPTFCLDMADGYKIVGKQIVAWHGDWYSERSEWAPHYYDFAWYRWDKKQFVLSKEGRTTKAYSRQQAEGAMPRFAINPRGAVLVDSGGGTIEQAVRSYCLSHRSPGWPKAPDRVSFKSKKIIGNWATITDFVVDARGKMQGEYCSYLLRMTAGRWKVVWWSDEKNIPPLTIQKTGVPRTIVKGLGWSEYEN